MCRCTIHLLRNFCLYHAVVLKLKSAVTRSVKVKYVGVFRLWNGFSLSSVFTIGILMTSCKLRKFKFSFHQKKRNDHRILLLNFSKIFNTFSCLTLQMQNDLDHFGKTHWIHIRWCRLLSWMEFLKTFAEICFYDLISTGEAEIPYFLI